MKTNLLIALTNLVKDPITNLSSHYNSTNRINNMGDALEFYIKDLFCNSLNENNIQKKNKIYNKYFSYIGNTTNPPDIMIKQGDAIEVKKIEKIGSEIALNSSYPKDMLYSDSPMITNGCRNCENWQKKDLIYAIGFIKEKQLNTLWLIYGNCYATSKDHYERIRNKISSGINGLEDVEFSKTKELGRVNKVDPLGITYLRIRGMWGIENPINVFKDVAPIDPESKFNVHAIVLKEKYLSFPKIDRKNIEKLTNDKFVIKDEEIQSPNNPAQLMDVKILSFRS